jgi:hypothetical protein
MLMLTLLGILRICVGKERGKGKNNGSKGGKEIAMEVKVKKP